jgi:hypothetical protein
MSDTATQTVNKLRLDLFRAIAGQIYHADADTPITTPSATDLASLLTLCTALAGSFNAHAANVVDPTSGAGVHGADSGHRVTAPAATDLGSARTLLADLETQLQRHADADGGAHFTPQLLTAPYFEMNGGIFEICAHANALAAQMNAHYLAALASGVAA